MFRGDQMTPPSEADPKVSAFFAQKDSWASPAAVLGPLLLDSIKADKLTLDKAAALNSGMLDQGTSELAILASLEKRRSGGGAQCNRALSLAVA